MFNNHIFYNLVFNFIILMSISAHSAANSINFETYLSAYIEQNESYIKSKYAEKISHSNFIIAADLFQNNLTIGPSFGSEKTSLASITTEDSSAQFNLLWLQKFPTGTSLQFEVLDLFNKPTNAFSSLDRQYKLSLSQSLWKNAYGQAQKLKRSAAKLNWEGSSLETQKILLQSCLEAIQNFAETFSHQQRVDIYNKLLKEAKQALYISEKSYQRRIIRKIDILAARADFLKMKARQTSALLQFIKYKNIFTTTAGLAAENYILLPISNSIKDWEPPKKALKSNLIAENILAIQLEAANDNVKSKKFLNRSELKLSLEAMQSEGIDSTSSGLTNYETNFVGLSLKLDWPIINKSLNENYLKAIYQKQISELNLQAQRKNSKINFYNLINVTASTSQLLELSQEKTRLYKNQIIEANRLLKAGKIEFENYILFRDAYLEEALNTINLEKTLIISNAKIAAITNQSQIICKGIL